MSPRSSRPFSVSWKETSSTRVLSPFCGACRGRPAQRGRRPGRQAVQPRVRAGLRPRADPVAPLRRPRPARPAGGVPRGAPHAHCPYRLTTGRRGPSLLLHRLRRLSSATKLLAGGLALSLALIVGVSAYLLISFSQQTRGA